MIPRTSRKIRGNRLMPGLKISSKKVHRLVPCFDADALFSFISVNNCWSY